MDFVDGEHMKTKKGELATDFPQSGTWERAHFLWKKKTNIESYKRAKVSIQTFYSQ